MEKNTTPPQNPTVRKHTWWKIALIVAFVPAFAVTAVIGSPLAKKLGLVKRDIGETSRIFNLDVTPSSGTFAIWGFIWTWQIVWIVYVFVCIFRKTQVGYVYQLPAFNWVIYPLNIFSYIASTAWVITFDRELLVWSFICLLSMPIVLHTSVGISCYVLKKNKDHMKKIGFGKDIWLIRILVQNGIAFYGTWVTIATLLNLGMLIVYRWGGDQMTASMTVLSLLSFIFTVFYITDNVFFYKYIQWIMSPYIVIIVALRGVLQKSWDMSKQKGLTAFALALLVYVSICLLVKLLIMARRMYKGRSKGKASINEFEKL